MPCTGKKRDNIINKMLLCWLKKVSDSQMSVAELRRQINNEVQNYKTLLGKTGVSVPVILEEDIDLSGFNIERLFEVLQNGNLDEYEISYIADALTLSESAAKLTEVDWYLIESFILEK